MSRWQRGCQESLNQVRRMIWSIEEYYKLFHFVNPQALTKFDAVSLLNSFYHLRNPNSLKMYDSISLCGEQNTTGSLESGRKKKKSSMHIKLSPSSVHRGTTLESLQHAGKIKVR